MITPLQAALDRDDPDGNLHKRDTDACCAIRKVEPMARAVEPFGAWLTGRKRFQAATRGALPVFEAVGPRIRINPLARWTTADLADYMRSHDLRENPLVAYGYQSIGCFPCTEPVKPGEDARSGRWAGQAKTECGIHLSGLELSLASASHVGSRLSASKKILPLPGCAQHLLLQERVDAAGELAGGGSQSKNRSICLPR